MGVVVTFPDGMRMKMTVKDLSVNVLVSMHRPAEMSAKHRNAQQDQDDTDDALHGKREIAWNRYLETHNKKTDQEQRCCVAQPPQSPDKRDPPQCGLGGDQSGHCHQVIRIEGMAQPKGKPEGNGH